MQRSGFPGPPSFESLHFQLAVSHFNGLDDICNTGVCEIERVFVSVYVLEFERLCRRSSVLLLGLCLVCEVEFDFEVWCGLLYGGGAHPAQHFECGSRGGRGGEVELGLREEARPRCAARHRDETREQSTWGDSGARADCLPASRHMEERASSHGKARLQRKAVCAIVSDTISSFSTAKTTFSKDAIDALQASASEFLSLVLFETARKAKQTNHTIDAQQLLQTIKTFGLSRAFAAPLKRHMQQHYDIQFEEDVKKTKVRQNSLTKF